MSQEGWWKDIIYNGSGNEQRNQVWGIRDVEAKIVQSCNQVPEATPHLGRSHHLEEACNSLWRPVARVVKNIVTEVCDANLDTLLTIDSTVAALWQCMGLHQIGQLCQAFRPESSAQVQLPLNAKQMRC